MQVSKLISRVKTISRRLEDIHFTDDYIISMFDEAQKDFARKTNLLMDTLAIPLESDKTIYDIERNGLLIKALYQATNIPLVSHEEMDEKIDKWESSIGCTPQYIVKGRMPNGMFKVYPTPSGDCSLGNIKLYYVAIPDDIISETDLINEFIPSRALEYYVLSDLFRSSIKDADKVFSKENYALYMAEIDYTKSQIRSQFKVNSLGIGYTQHNTGFNS